MAELHARQLWSYPMLHGMGPHPMATPVHGQQPPRLGHQCLERLEVERFQPAVVRKAHEQRCLAAQDTPNRVLGVREVGLQAGQVLEIGNQLAADHRRQRDKPRVMGGIVDLVPE